MLKGLFLFTYFSIFALMAKAQDRPVIDHWKSITTPPKFILYNYLVKESHCFDKDEVYLWDYHVREFKKKNPFVTDADNIEVNSQIEVQVCKTRHPPPLNSPPVVEVEEAKPVEESALMATNEMGEGLLTNTHLFLGVGFLSESYNDYLSTSPSATFRINSEIHQRLYHRLMVDFSSTVIYLRNKIDFKTGPERYQYFISVGMGNRVGVQKNVDLKVSTNISNYLDASVGFDLKFKNHLNLIMEVGSTFNSKAPVNFSVIAQKRLGKSDYSLGGYFDYVWTDSSLLDTDKNHRHFLGSGIIFSY